MPINILDWHAGRVSHSGKMAIKKVEKIKALHLLILEVSHGPAGPLVQPHPPHSPLGLGSSLHPTPSLDASIKEVIKIIRSASIFFTASINIRAPLI